MNQETPNENLLIQNYIESKDYQINIGDTPCNILIGKTEKDVIISSFCFFTNINHNEFDLAINKKFESLNELYIYIINIFDKKNVKIDFNENKEIQIELLLLNGKKIQIASKYCRKNIDYIINHLWCKYNKIEKDLNHIQEENINLKNDYINLKTKIGLLQEENNLIRQNNQKLKEEINLLKNENKKIKEENNKSIENYNDILEKLNSIKKEIKSYNNNINNNFNTCFIQPINNNFNNDIINENNNNNTFSLIFKENGGNGKIITLDDCSSSEKISELMERYKKKKRCDGNFYFTHNTITLNQNNTLGEVKLKNYDKINVMRIKDS